MAYTIKRECWNDKTYNGYDDNPYWRIDVNDSSYGLHDSGKVWEIGNSLPISYSKSDILNIIQECKLNITLIDN